METLSQSVVERIQNQYDRFPYPKKGLGLPVASATYPLAYELGQYLRTGTYVEHDSTRILVAGCGAFEPIAVARANPDAHLTALDLSSRALFKLRVRSLFTGLSSSIKPVLADLHDDLTAQLGTFDYIVCTGVLHHSPQPWLMLQRLSAMLKPTGVLRIMVYPPTSRLWIYELKTYFREKGLKLDAKTSPRKLALSCRALVAELADDDPRRLAFENYSDARNIPGLIDGFFHPHDTPIPFGLLHRYAEIAGLKLIGAEPSFEDLPKSAAPLNAWQKLQLLDDLCRLSKNPVLWLAREPLPVEVRLPTRIRTNPVLEEEVSTLDALLDGRALGCDGALPPPLFEKRCLTGPLEREEEMALDLAANDRILQGLSAARSALDL